jgi:polysaccharide biosynthesis/export protein
MKALSLLCIFVIVATSGMSAHPQASPLQAAPQAQTYAIGPQDVLTINVWGQPDLSGKFTVEADGTFSFPLLGRVKVGGSNLREVETALVRLLEDRQLLKNAQVSASVDEYRSQRIFVVGEVRAPGPYPLTGAMTLIEALARAGSTTERAREEAIIVRSTPGAASAGPVLPTQLEGNKNVSRVVLNDLQAGAAAANVLLQNGDTVFVPRAENMFVFGQVRNPGSYALRSDTTVLQALSLAGGVTDRGATNRIRIIRMVDGKQREVKASLDDLMRAGDTLVVPERFF